LRLILRRDKPLTEEIFERLAARLKPGGWGMGNEERFEASRELNIQLTISPDMSIEALMARVDDVAARTLLAISAVTGVKADESGPKPS